MTLFRICPGWVLAVCALLAGLVEHNAAADPVAYNTDIRPILSDSCFPCHGPDQAKRKAKLRLDIRDQAISKEAIVPGDPDESELVRRIFSEDEDDLMPPPKSHKKLTLSQKDLIRRWVLEGAEYEGHWAYIPPVKPTVSTGMNAIDALVRERLGGVGIQSSPEADRRTLARRLFFDLVGLPPTPAEVQRFERDPDPGAYENLVDTLLSSPRYGERMAIGWLDVVRYADTIGYHSDNPRNVWPYRDYVIAAFNENKPFDQFTVEQLAGDLLPDSTLEQKVASAFNRLLLSTEEGGAQPKDYEARMLTDRVRAVGAVWLGQTLGCAQCHDHKFDPITARDFYSMGAFFADIKEPIIGRREEGMLVPDVDQAAELKRLEAEVARWNDELNIPRPELQGSWERAASKAIADEPRWVVLNPEEASAENGGKLRAAADGSVIVEEDSKGASDTYALKVKPGLSGIVAFRLEALTSDKAPARGPGWGEDGGFALTEFFVTDDVGNTVDFVGATATYEDEHMPALAAVDGVIESGNGWGVRGMSGVSQAINFAALEPVDADNDTALTLTMKFGTPRLARFRISAALDPAVVEAPKTAAPPRDIAEILATPCEERSKQQTDKLAAYYRRVAPELAGLRARTAAAQKAKDEYEASLPHCLVSTSMDEPRVVRILPRGDWMSESGEVVRPALPSYLAGPAAESASERLTRLDLANWLVSRENPLTARVVVNRIWRQFFGTGLSKVLDDFGSQGEPPPNQPLLDWLACEFMDSDWDIRHMVRLIVTSHTYRQVSTASKDLRERDPDNRLLARQSSWRLEAELIRDNALSLAGLLTPRIGGPSVKPYQPEGYWENLNFPVRTYQASEGEDQYRRGLYTWWQRSYLHPSLLAFDAPTREECAAERGRSNIPQQALALLNDPTFVEAARVFAARILMEGGEGVTDRVEWAWLQAFSRPPRPDETRIASELLENELAEYKRNGQARSLLSVGTKPAPSCLDPVELAAWTSVARVLFNLHEIITRS